MEFRLWYANDSLFRVRLAGQKTPLLSGFSVPLILEPRFRGIREDVSRLARYIELEWIRNRRKQSKPKNLPYKIGYCAHVA